MTDSNRPKRYESTFVPALRDPTPRVEIVEVSRDLPAPPQTVLLPQATYTDRARGFSLATLPLGIVAGFVAALVGVIGWQVPIASLVTLLLAPGAIYAKSRKSATSVTARCFVTNQVVRTISRKGEIAQAKPQRFVLVQRAAEQLSRRNVDQATTELLNEALARLTALCYERDATGHLCNVDAATGRVLVPLPWGKAGYAKWGLTPSEGNTMRRVMLTRQRLGEPLYFYDVSRRAWYLNMDFDGAVVLRTLAEWEIAIVEYRQARRR